MKFNVEGLYALESSSGCLCVFKNLGNLVRTLSLVLGKLLESRF